jgi:signal transduction histidine kinase
LSKLVIAAMTTAALLILSALRMGDLWWWRTQTLNAAESRASNLSFILSEYLHEAFTAGDASLRQLTAHSRRVGGPGAPDSEWLPPLNSARAGLTGVASISVTDKDGVIRHSTLPQLVGQPRRDEYVFQQLSKLTTDELVVSTPYLAPRQPPLALIPIGRRLTDDAGRFEGTIVATFTPATRHLFFRTVDVGTRGAIWFFHPNGTLLFREPSAGTPLGEMVKDNPVFVAATAPGSPRPLRGPITPGGPAMLSAFHISSTPPLIVAVSLDRSEVLAEWRHQIRGSGLFFLAIVFTVAGTLTVLFRQMDAKAAAERALSDAQQAESARLNEVNERLFEALEGERRARRESEAASTLKDEFLMTVSHELRTPLTAIQGWAHMLASGDLDERRRTIAVETIDRNARAQTRLVNDLLDVSRAISGKLRLETRTLALVDLVRDAVETIRPAADAKSIRIDTDFDAAIGPFSGDPDRLAQVVWNLLSNAIKFTPVGGRVAVRARRLGTDVEIVVADSGLGISAEFLPHVFERFRQAEGGSTRRFGGLGLGLAIVRHIVELHGGSVRAESAGEGHGATFHVRLPMKPIHSLS